MLFNLDLQFSVFGWALAMFVAVGFFDEPEFDRRAIKAIVFAKGSFHVALV